MTATSAILEAAPAIKRSEHKIKSSPESRRALARFAHSVRKRRESMGVTFTELKDRLGISKSHMSHIECGDNWPSMAVYVALCRELRVGTPPLVGK